jgi:hypothetical protein
VKRSRGALGKDRHNNVDADFGDLGFIDDRSRAEGARDYLQGYLEYARTVSEGAGDSGRSLLDHVRSLLI